MKSNTCHDFREPIHGEIIRAPKAKVKKKIALAMQAPAQNCKVLSKLIETVPINTNVSM